MSLYTKKNITDRQLKTGQRPRMQEGSSIVRRNKPATRGLRDLDPSVVDLIDDDNCTWEQEPLKKLAQMNQLSAFHHNGFWQPMDTLREKIVLNELWDSDKAPWKIWK